MQEVRASVFTKIIQGDIPCHKVYEDQKTLAFMDINPIQPGHVLVVPKRQVDFIWNLDDEDYQAVMATGRRVGQALQRCFPEAKRVGIMVEGLDIADHCHIKVFPFSTMEQYRHIPNEGAPEGDALAAIAAKLREALS